MEQNIILAGHVRRNFDFILSYSRIFAAFGIAFSFSLLGCALDSGHHSHHDMISNQ